MLSNISATSSFLVLSVELYGLTVLIMESNNGFVIRFSQPAQKHSDIYNYLKYFVYALTMTATYNLSNINKIASKYLGLLSDVKFTNYLYR